MAASKMYDYETESEMISVKPFRLEKIDRKSDPPPVYSPQCAHTVSTHETNPDICLEAKYIELMKNFKELSSAHEIEKNRSRNLSQQIVFLERELREYKQVQIKTAQKSKQLKVHTGVVEENSDEESSKNSAAKLEPKTRSIRVIADLRIHQEELKREISIMKQVLQSEVGDGVDIENLIAEYYSKKNRETQKSETTGSLHPGPKESNRQPPWRGRAQQITLLRSKIKDLERQLQMMSMKCTSEYVETKTEEKELVLNTVIRDSQMDRSHNFALPSGITQNSQGDSTVENSKVSSSNQGVIFGGKQQQQDFDENHRSYLEVKENKFKQDVHELRKALSLKQEEVLQLQRKVEASNARALVLGREQENWRRALQRVIEKTLNDDKLIEMYRQELSKLQNEFQRNKCAQGPVLRTLEPRDSQEIDVSTEGKITLLSLHQDVMSLLKQNMIKDDGTQVSETSNSWRVEVFHLRRLLTLVYDFIMYSPMSPTSTESTLEEKNEQCDSALWKRYNLLKEENKNLRERLTVQRELSRKEIEILRCIADEPRTLEQM